MHLDRHVRFQRQCFLEAALADETPGADHVGNDVDATGFGWACSTPIEATLTSVSLGGNHPLPIIADHQAVERIAGLERCHK